MFHTFHDFHLNFRVVYEDEREDSADEKNTEVSLLYNTDRCSWRLNLGANYDITKSSKPARLAIIQLNILI